MYRLPTINIQFANKINPTDLVYFRGAVIASLEEKNILFHNHDNDKLRYSYPLIQYKRIHGKAAVTGVAKGVEVISQLLGARDFNFRLGKKSVEMQIESVNFYDNKIELEEEPNFRYRLSRWLPLNSGNYAQYQRSEGMVERIMILEHVLVGNILSFLKGVGIYLDEQIELHITHIADPYSITYKNVRLMAFDIAFKSNISLPQYIGLGKNASVGCGVLTKIIN